jgi:methylated-DNA-protein-cysteine methyltransferase-like protein
MGMFENFYNAVRQIPKGKVASYGFIARISGYPRASRQVGWALHQNPDPSTIPCHRVVKKDGSLSESFVFGGINMQEKLLLKEGITIENGRVNMALFSIDAIDAIDAIEKGK